MQFKDERGRQRNDLGITFLPEIAIRGGILKNTKIEVEDLPERSHRTIGLAWRKSSVRKPEFQLLGKTILEAI